MSITFKIGNHNKKWALKNKKTTKKEAIQQSPFYKGGKGRKLHRKSYKRKTFGDYELD